MKGWAIVYAGVLAAFLLLEARWSGRLAFRVGFGMAGLLGLGIAGTFLWLWLKRATPLALGMALSWAGAGLMIAWGWHVAIWRGPVAAGHEHAVFAFLALHMTGALVHLRLVADAAGRPRGVFWGALAVLSAALLAAMMTTG